LTRGPLRGPSRSKGGGTNHIVKYTGYLTDNFTLSSLYGQGRNQRYDQPAGEAGAVCPYVEDERKHAADRTSGCWVTAAPERPDAASDHRAFRIDAEWHWGDHDLRFGYDAERYTVTAGQEYAGGVFWDYEDVKPGTELTHGIVPADVNQLVIKRVFHTGGTFRVDQAAEYVEDRWQITPNLLLNLGLRNEQLDNRNASGISFVKLDRQLAPRLGFSWDVRGDASLKIFGSAGRYHLPIAAAVNLRASGPQLYTLEYFPFTAIDRRTGVPTLGPRIGELEYVNESRGNAHDPRAIASRNLSPMYQDEFILGLENDFGNNWSGGVRAIHRDLRRAIDDFCDRRPFIEWAEAHGKTYSPAWTAPGCFLFNPGQAATYQIDIDDDGQIDTVDLTARQIGMPKARRRYMALEFFFQHAWDEKWFLRGSYTYARNEGNTEGGVKSDIGQDDTGITQDFDLRELMIGAYGPLPNERRHTLKLFGAVALGEEWRVGSNLLLQSGRPKNCFGMLPANMSQSESYKNDFFFCRGVPTPRGSQGRTPWITQVDLNLEYRPAFADGNLALRLDVFNVLNAARAITVSEQGESDTGLFLADRYGIPMNFQTPRYIRLSAQYDFSM